MVIKMAARSQERMDQRRKVLKDGKIVSRTLHGAIDVRIRNLSASGALLELPAATGIPDDAYGLLVVWESKIYPAATRWRKGDRMGVEFTGRPKLASLRKW
jgi:hypothetical protein